MNRFMSFLAPCTFVLVTGCASEQPFTGQTFARGVQQNTDSQQGAYPVLDPNVSLAMSSNANSEMNLISTLVALLDINSQQAMGGVGSIFALAQQRMNPSDFIQLNGSIPGMDQYLSAVPQAASSFSWFSLTESLLGGQTTGLGSLAVLAGSFQTLGMNTNMISQFVPVVLQYVQAQSGAEIMNLLQSALYR